MSDAEKNSKSGTTATVAAEDDGFGDMDLGIPTDDKAAAAPDAASSEKAPKTPKTPRAKKDPTLHKRAEKPALTPKDKFVKKLLRKAGVTAAPELSQLVAGKVGDMVEIKDIGIFIGDSKDDVLKALSKECTVKNRCNLSAEVTLDQVLKVGAQIIADGRMFQPITCAKVAEDNALECTSGRHRLVFLALLYGATSKIPVYVENMPLNIARDAVIRSNESRPTKAMERAEHAILSAVGGDATVKQDELYEKSVKSKMKARKYCVFSVLERKHPCKLGFPVSLTASRKDGGLTTVTNVENYWNASLLWTKDMDRKTFDHALKASTEFLSAFVKAAQAVEGFDADQHLASMTLSAVGKYYIDALNVKGEAPSADKVAAKVVAMGDIGRQKSEKTYAAITKAFQK